MIEFNEVCKSWNGRSVFSGLTFTVGAGESIGLLGRSGIGKTTIPEDDCRAGFVGKSKDLMQERAEG